MARQTNSKGQNILLQAKNLGKEVAIGLHYDDTRGLSFVVCYAFTLIGESRARRKKNKLRNWTIAQG
jgi:hypothetical protein